MKNNLNLEIYSLNPFKYLRNRLSRSFGNQGLIKPSPAKVVKKTNKPKILKVRPSSPIDDDTTCASTPTSESRNLLGLENTEWTPRSPSISAQLLLNTKKKLRRVEQRRHRDVMSDILKEMKTCKLRKVPIVKREIQSNDFFSQSLRNKFKAAYHSEDSNGNGGEEGDESDWV